MIILDTDCLSLLERERALESSKLIRKLEEHIDEDVCTTIITFEEQMRGWLAFLSRCKHVKDQVGAYERLHRFLESYRNTPVLDFDENATEVYSDLKASKVRIGSMDLKIASIAIANKAMLVTRNLGGFRTRARPSSRRLDMTRCSLVFHCCPSSLPCSQKGLLLKGFLRREAARLQGRKVSW